MSRLQKMFTLGASLAVLALPLGVAHAQVMSPYGYNSTYYPTTNYNSTYYPTTNSDQYYNNSSYPTTYQNTYPTTNYNNSYYPSNGYGYGNGYYPYSYPAPTCTLSITSPTSYNGGAVQGTVSWTTNAASTVYISNVGEVNTVGSLSVSMYPGEVFTLSMSGPGGNGTCQNEYYPPTPSYYGYGQQYPYYNSTPSYYPTYPSTYVAPTTYVVPIINRPIYNPITTIRNWWQNTMRW